MIHVCRHVRIFLGLHVLFFAPAAYAEDWPQFRGPTGLGYSSERELPTVWGGRDKKNVLWTAPLVGEGHASPIVWKDRVFVCTVRWPESVKDRAKVIPEHHVLCYSAGAGDVTRTHIKWRQERLSEGIGSPIIVNGLVYRLQSPNVLKCWRAGCGHRSASPLPQAGFVHSTPVLIHANDKPQFIAVASGMAESAEGMQSFDPASGKRLWWCKGPGEGAPPWAEPTRSFQPLLLS